MIEESSNVLIDNGITKAPTLVGLDDKDSIVKALSLHFIILSSKGELDQLKDGLRTLGVGDAMEISPDLFEPIFTNFGQVELTPGTLHGIPHVLSFF